MRKWKQIIAMVAFAAFLFVGFVSGANVPEVKAELAEKEIINSGSQWRYLDDNTDPNLGTFYADWNIRFGWTFPLGYKAYGVVPMNFSDETWSDGYGPFSLEGETALNKIDETDTPAPAYFFRHTFNIENPNDIKAISGKIKYNDSATIYINGKPIEQSFNIPDRNYRNNLDYGCKEKLDKKYEKASFIVSDLSMLLKGENVIGVEVHTSDKNDTDVYFEMNSLVLNPDKSILPESEDIKNIAVNTGADESQLNFAWYALSNNTGQVQIAKNENNGTKSFPVDSAKTFSASEHGSAYTKFYSDDYFYNHVTVSSLEPNTEYIYRVGSDEGWSESYTISTKDISDGYEVLFVSDAQIGTGTITTDKYGWDDTLAKALNLYPDISFIANAGDFVDLPTNESEYDGYFSPDLLKQYPSATTPGNHDVAKNYSQHFNQPNESALGSNNAGGDYYFTYGNVLYIVLNTNSTNTAEHEQFIDETLEKTSDQDFDWKIALFHQSLYCSAEQSNKDSTLKRRDELVPVLDKAGFDIVLSGHDHSYVRSHHMKNFEIMEKKEVDKDGFEVKPEGILYLTMSSASGSKYYPIIDDYDYSAYQFDQGDHIYIPTFARFKITDNTFSVITYRTDTMEAIDTYSMKKTVDSPTDKTDPTSDIDTKTTAIKTGSINPKTGESRTPVIIVSIFFIASVSVLVTTNIKKDRKKGKHK